jgi:hypothetical protein
MTEQETVRGMTREDYLIYIKGIETIIKPMAGIRLNNVSSRYARHDIYYVHIYLPVGGKFHNLGGYDPTSSDFSITKCVQSQRASFDSVLKPNPDPNSYEWVRGNFNRSDDALIHNAAYSVCGGDPLKAFTPEGLAAVGARIAAGVMDDSIGEIPDKARSLFGRYTLAFWYASLSPVHQEPTRRVVEKNEAILRGLQ